VNERPLETWPDALECACADTTHFRQVRVLRETASTQDAADEGGLPVGSVVTAGRQSAGRGRLGHAWADTADDGIAVTFVVQRQDPERLAMAAEVQTNWMPRVLGAASLRPGFKYLGTTASSAAAKYLRHIFATDDTSLVELTSGAMRVWINDTLLTRPSVATTITNGTFLTDMTGWTSVADEGSAASTWASAGNLQLVGAVRPFSK
jgi:hypothetical protein